MKSQTSKKQSSPGNNTSLNSGGNWILGLIIIIVIVLVIIIFSQKFKNPATATENFTNLNINVLDAGGQRANNDVQQLTKWNADKFQHIQLMFNNSTEKITKVRLEFKDTVNNNIYSYSAEDNIGTPTTTTVAATATTTTPTITGTTPPSIINNPFNFYSLNLPPKRTFVLYVYLNDNSSARFMTYLDTADFLFNFTDINGNLVSADSSDPTLKCIVKNPDSDVSYGDDNVSMGTLKMQPFNLISIPVKIPSLMEFKNKLRVLSSTDAIIKDKHDQKINELDSFVFKEIEARLVVLTLPPTMTTATPTIPTTTNASGMTGSTQQQQTGQTITYTIADFTSSGITENESSQLLQRFPNSFKLITPGSSDCAAQNSNKCKIHIKNVINGVKYRLEYRAVFQQLGSIEPNIRYTTTQKIVFGVTNSNNPSADLNETIGISDIGKKFRLTRQQKEFITNDQARQDAVMNTLENDINSLGTNIYNNIDRRI